MVKGREVDEGFRCGCPLFLCCVRSSEYLPLGFAESRQGNPKRSDVTPDRLQISAQPGVMRTENISREKDHDEDPSAVAVRKVNWVSTTLNSEVAVDLWIMDWHHATGLSRALTSHVTKLVGTGKRD